MVSKLGLILEPDSLLYYHFVENFETLVKLVGQTGSQIWHVVLLCDSIKLFAIQPSNLVNDKMWESHYCYQNIVMVFTHVWMIHV